MRLPVRESRRLFSVVLTTSVLVLLLLAPASARADGLFYQLPADGASARFDMQMKGGPPGGEREMSGSLTMSSVGRVEHEGQPARWIEVKLTMKEEFGEQTIVAKTLILEKHLKRGENPFGNFIKCYVRHGEAEVKDVKDTSGDDAGPLPAFLAGPLDNAKELDPAETDSALGKVACKGQTGKLVVPEGNRKVHVEFENRLHERAPFGVVTSTMKFSVKQEEETRESGVIELKLAEVGMGAKSELPDSN
jgi:hypothetical protein